MSDTPHEPLPPLEPPAAERRGGWFAALGPGILVAATGVGAGDLLTAGLAGSALGTKLLWAAWLGALLKWVLNEGIARWQMATGTTLLEGWVQRLGAWIQWVFLGYLLVWSIAVSGALSSACGAAGTALWPLCEDLVISKRVWGIIHAGAALVLVRYGGFGLFEKLMGACIGVMFCAVLATAILIGPAWSEVAAGALWPAIPDVDGSGASGLGWTLGVLGGVGGTVTLLSYGYWIRERGRRGAAGLRACRLDLGVGYALTALFGMAMIVIGSRVHIERGPGVPMQLASQLEIALGPTGRWVFLCGFWGAVFSSTLGVWQSVPYMFADFVRLRGERSARARRRATGAERATGSPGGSEAGQASVPSPADGVGLAAEPIEPVLAEDLSQTPAYRGYLLALAILPLPLLWLELRTVQLVYAVGGALFMPLLALTLLLMNRRIAWVGRAFRNRWPYSAALGLTLMLFGYMGAAQLHKTWLKYVAGS